MICQLTKTLKENINEWTCFQSGQLIRVNQRFSTEGIAIKRHLTCIEEEFQTLKKCKDSLKSLKERCDEYEKMVSVSWKLGRSQHG